MSALPGIVAGFVVIGGAVAAYRFAKRKTVEVRDAVEELRRTTSGEHHTLNFERDPATGVYRSKQ